MQCLNLSRLRLAGPAVRELTLLQTVMVLEQVSARQGYLQVQKRAAKPAAIP